MFNRRTFLRAAGVCMPLPWLESLVHGAEAARAAAAGPGRAVFFMVPSGVNMWRWHPKEFGPEYQLSSTLAALEPYRKDMTIFSGLEHPKGGGGGHFEVGVWLTGNTKYENKDSLAIGPNTISIDQHIANAVGGQTRIPSLVLSAPGGTVTSSYDAKGAPVSAENNLRRLFGELFGSPDVMQRLARRASLLDLVGEQAKSLTQRLGQSDQRRLDEYLESVRSVESRLQADRGYFASQPLPINTEDLKLDVDPQQQREDYFKTMLELVALALRNDQTRTVSILACGSGHEFFAQWPEFGTMTHHQASHATNFKSEEDEAKHYALLEGVDKWFVAHLARFLQRLEETQDGDGTLLENTMVLYGGGMSWTHQASNLPMLLAGGSNLGLKHGSHLRFNPHKNFQGQLEKGVKPEETFVADVLRTMSERLGVAAAGFGGSRRVVDDLLA